MKKLAVLLSVVMLLAACSNPMETIIPSDIASWDKDLAPAIKSMSDADKALFAGYAARVKLGELFGAGGGIPLGTTVGQAIDTQKKWVTEQKKAEEEAKALRVKVEADQLATIKAINAAVTVTLLSKHAIPSNYRVGRYSDTQQFIIVVKNKSAKELVGVSGELEFIDVFDRVVGSTLFSISEKIKPDDLYTWIGERDYNQYIAEHKAIWNLEEGKYTTRFTPAAVVYADGSKIKMPE